MKLTRLFIRNFMAISEASLALDDRGLVLVQGKNLDDTSAASNGAGKSSIPDALSWCLFGETARGETGDAIVSRKAGKQGTMVQAVLVDEDASYLITRYRKDMLEKNRLTVKRVQDGIMTDITKGTDKLTQALVVAVLGCSQEVFNASIYAGQERMPDLPGMTDKQLKELIEEAAGITELQTYYERARDMYRALEAVHQKYETHADKLASNAGILQRTLAKAQDSASGWEGKQLTELGELGKALATYPTAEKLEGYLKELREEIAGKSEAAKALTEKARSPDEKREALKKIITDTDRHIAGLQRDRKRLGDELRAGKLKFDAAGERVGQPCPSCARPLTEAEVAELKASLKRDLKAKAAEYTTVNTEYDKQVALRETFKLKLGEHEAAHSVESLLLQVEALNAEIKMLSDKERIAADSLRKVASLEEKIAAKKAETNPYLEQVVDLTQRLDALAVEQRETQEALEAALQRLTLQKAAVEVFSPAGVRAHVLDLVTPYLNARTAQYLAALSDGNLWATWSTLSTTAKGELRERFCIEVGSKTGGESFGLLSGGEKRKVRLATALALQDLVATRATKPIRLFIADEIDDALDESGLERLMTILDEKARERGTVLVISHNSLSDWIREVITVEKSGGQSTVKGALCV